MPRCRSARGRAYSSNHSLQTTNLAKVCESLFRFHAIYSLNA